jgi:hypothetical protein
MFRSAGRLEGMDEEADADADGGERGAAAAAAAAAGGEPAAARKKARRAAFDEDDQAALYNRLQAAQRQGRRGMGKAEVKISGAPTSSLAGLGLGLGAKGDEREGRRAGRRRAWLGVAPRLVEGAI